MEATEEKESAVGTFACSGCGADLSYQPGTSSLSCSYCGAENEIPEIQKPINELDFHAFLSQQSTEAEQLVQHFVKCDCCGASCTLEPNITAEDCAYCGTALVVEHATDDSVIQPKSLLPFKLDKDEALTAFKGWVAKLWFAPNDLKKASLNFDHFKGVYIPYWTYDTDTFSAYIGQRGTYYYVNETYTTQVDGKSVTKTRRVRKIRWSFASGSVSKFFDDLLIPATQSVPKQSIEKLEPWDLENLVPFDKSYLSGFISEKYQIGLEDGFDEAKTKAEPTIRKLIKRDIGGDEQRITRIDTSYNNITFKHLLLPVYACAYRFKGKAFQFLVNARTGEVQGARPYSWVKIAALALAIAAVIAAIVIAKTQTA